MQNTAYSQIAATRIPVLSAKVNKGSSMNTGKIIADNLSKAGWSYGYVSVVDSKRRPIWIADAHRNVDQ
jgi:hypothetical protein